MITPVHLALTAQSTATFVFTKPVADYGKTAPGVTLTDAGGAVAPTFATDVDNGDGTMTGTVNFGATITGDVDFLVYDRA